MRLKKGKICRLLVIWFYKDELGDYDSKNYEIDLSKITMYPYQSEK